MQKGIFFFKLFALKYWIIMYLWIIYCTDPNIRPPKTRPPFSGPNFFIFPKRPEYKAPKMVPNRRPPSQKILTFLFAFWNVKKKTKKRTTESEIKFWGHFILWFFFREKLWRTQQKKQGRERSHQGETHSIRFLFCFVKSFFAIFVKTKNILKCGSLFHLAKKSL